ncbi:hypothetical protein niasHT_029298 [Heterodera trifolii]|uniref:Effector protein n=1 Tax=Heterodera trifolii TaxID=157864 RepID=A0ABD2KD75_9BILA
MVSQFSSNFIRTVLSLIFIKTLICPNVEASDQVTIKAYCVEIGNGDFPFYYTFKYERNIGEDGTECDDYADKKDRKLESLLWSYHNEKEKLEERKKEHARLKEFKTNDLEAMLRAYDQGNPLLFMSPISKQNEQLEEQPEQSEKDDDDLNLKMEQLEEQSEQSEKDDDELNLKIKKMEEQRKKPMKIKIKMAEKLEIGSKRHGKNREENSESAAKKEEAWEEEEEKKEAEQKKEGNEEEEKETEEEIDCANSL